MISDELQERAALHALGLLRGEEAATFEKQCVENAELAALVRKLRDSADSLASALPSVAPPAGLRQLVPAGQQKKMTDNGIPLPAVTASRRWQSVAALAALLTTTALAAWWAIRAMQAESAASAALKSVRSLQQERDNLIVERDGLAEREATIIRARNSALEQTKKELADALTQSAKLQADVTMLQADKERLLAEVTKLQARGLYDRARIAVMASTTKPAGKASAVSLWDQEAQGGVIVVQNLPALPAERNYQLWVLDNNVPVSAGLLTLDGKGGGRIEFKPRKPIAAPTLFAVTNETKGEKESPDLKKLVLAGQ